MESLHSLFFGSLAPVSDGATEFVSGSRSVAV